MPDYELWSGKPRLPKEQSYTIKRAEFDAFLEREQISEVTGFWYCGADDSGRVFSATDYGESSGVNVYFYAVPSAFRPIVVDAIVTTVLPAFAHWTRRYADKSLLIAQMPHRLDAFYEIPANQDKCEVRLHDKSGTRNRLP